MLGVSTIDFIPEHPYFYAFNFVSVQRLCKQISYNPASHRQLLVPTWISKASATQRAGRTGRVRKGNVYRLYSRNAFQQYMPSFDMGEMVRIPLDQVILVSRS